MSYIGACLYSNCTPISKLIHVNGGGGGVAVARHNLNPFKPDFTIVSFIHYKLRIAVAILDL